MTTTIKFLSAEIELKKVLGLMLVGATLGLGIISLFVFGVDHPHPSWPDNWRVRPLIITPIAAAFGMLSFLLSEIIGVKKDWGKILVFLISLIIFLLCLWLGTVLGLAGTLWN